MPTQQTPRGKLTNLLFGDQAAFDTAATGNYISTPFYSESLADSASFEDDPILGTPRNNSRDQLAPAPGLVSLAGDITVPFCANHFVYWLTALFGAPVTAGTGPYTHTFTSGGDALPYRTLEFEKRAGVAFFQSLGLMANGLSLDFGRAAGFRQATINMLGRSQGKIGATAGGAPAAQLALARIPAAVGICRVGGVDAADFLSGSLNYSNNAAADEALNGTEYISGFVLDDDGTLNGGVTFRYRDETYYDIMNAGDPVPVEFEFALDANRKINFAMANARFERNGFAPISGPGGLQAEFNYRGEQSSADPMLTVTVTNQIASY